MKTTNLTTAKSQAGFTLIEIAVVLVIIGLLLGGVLQGQQLIENSRVKSATNDFNGIAAAAFSYQDRYGRLPGDDPNATTARGDSWSAFTAGGDGNGVVDTTLSDVFDQATTADEGDDFFGHLRAAGFIQGDSTLTGAQALPQNPFGGLTSVTSESSMGMAGTKVCMSQVGGSASIALDTQLDDSDPDNGRLRATLGASGANTAPSSATTSTAYVSGTTASGTFIDTYSEDEVYTICYRI